jgi:SAM-dependent methyltransferase
MINNIIEKYLEKEHKFGKNVLYQSCGNSESQRSTENRVKLYKIDDSEIDDKDILDIGCNIASFGFYFNHLYRSYEGIEKDKDCCNVSKGIIKENNVKKMSISNMGFEEYNTDKKFDIIFSFAVHFWVGLPLEIYLKKLRTFLNKGGKIFIESHNLTDKFDKDFLKKIKSIPFFQIDDIVGPYNEDKKINRIFIKGGIK